MSALVGLVTEVVALEAEPAAAMAAERNATIALKRASERASRAVGARMDLGARLEATQAALQVIVSRDRVRPEAIERIRAEVAR